MRQANPTSTEKRLRVAVLRDRYQSSFMSPRDSRHDIDRRWFLPLNLANRALDGLTVAAPGLPVDLIHAHNRIPLGASRLIISFESALPRRYALKGNNAIVRTMTNAIRSRRCRRIIGMSHFARRLFVAQHQDAPYFDVLDAKCMVRHPNLPLTDNPDTLDLSEDAPLGLAFVGSHFGRKGGCVAVRIAELAHQRSLPVHITIISSLDVGDAIWVDPTTEGFFDPYFELLKLPTVSFLGARPNTVVHETLAASHFALLPTFADTFGYSAIEAMANHTPVIGTDVCALPEFIDDGINGLMLPMETTTTGAWAGEDYNARGDAAYARRFAEETDRLAEATLDRLTPYLNDRAALRPLRLAARDTAIRMFAAEPAGKTWDDLYSRVAAEPLDKDPLLDPLVDMSSPSSYAEARGATPA